MTLRDDAKLALTISEVNHDFAELSDWGKAAVRLAKAVLEAGKVDGACEFCGAPAKAGLDDVAMTCGTWWDVFDGWMRSDECRDRQVARLTAKLATAQADLADHQQRLMRQSAELNAVRQERDELKQRIAAAPVAWVQFGNHNNPCEISEDRETFWAGEHPPGTLRQCCLLEVRDGK